MLATLVVWVIVATTAWVYGNLCLAPRGDFPNASSFSPEDAGLKIYFGLLLISSAMMGAALVATLSWWFGLLLMAPGILLGVRHLSSAKFRNGVASPGPRLWKLAVGALVVLALFVSSREVNFYDTGLYHQQAVKWLSRYGLVPGLALLHVRLGWTSSWFAGAAALNHGVLAGREAPIVGGIPFALMIVTSLGILSNMRAARSIGTLRSLTWLVFCALLTVATITWNEESSLSADPMIWLLPLIVSFIESDGAQSQPDRAGRGLLAAALASTIRLTSLPLLAYTGVLWAWSFLRSPASQKRLLAYAGTASALLLLVAAANKRTSGCPLFPSPLACATDESSVGPAVAFLTSADIRSFAAQGNRHLGLLVSLALVASLVGFRLRRKDAFLTHALATSWSGILFLLVTAPNPRFSLGSFCLPVAACAAALINWLDSQRPTVINSAYKAIPVFVVGLGIVAVLSSIHGANSLSSLVLPAKLAGSEGDPIHIVNRRINVRTKLDLLEQQAGDVIVLRPQSSDQCWDAPLPCTPQTTVESLRLRDPRKGLSAGFRSDVAGKSQLE